MGTNKNSKIKHVEFYARYIWPLHRKFVKKHLSKRCDSCILSEKYTSLENGLCLECKTFISKNRNLQSLDNKEGLYKKYANDFQKIIEDSQGKGSRKYDAMVLLSGGKDSALLLYKLKKEYPDLRILAYTVDNGFFSPVARENIERIINKLNVDHIIHRPSVSLFQKGFNYAIHNIGKLGCSEVVDRLDGDLLHDLARHTAAEMKIPLLLSGVSWAQVEQIFEVEHFEMPVEKELEPRTHTGKINISSVFDADEQKNWWNPNLYPKSDIARFLFPFYAWRYDEEEIKKQVVELGLIEKNKISPLVSNNDMIPVMGLIDINKIGYSSFEPEFASMIREGKADKKLWNNIFEINEFAGKTGWLLGKEVKETLEKLNINSIEVGLPI